MRIGFKTSQTNVDWPTLRATWELGDTLQVFDSGWIFDHFVALGDDGGGSHEALVLIGALAVVTKRLQLGHLVLGNTYRHPALVAKSGATLDHLSNGRFVLGLGAGWHEEEHAMYGMELPPIGERITMLDSAVRVIKALWEHPDGVSLDAPPYGWRDAVCDPAPLTPGGPADLAGRAGRGAACGSWPSARTAGTRPAIPPPSSRSATSCCGTARRLAATRLRSRSAPRPSCATATTPRCWRSRASFAGDGAEHVILIMPASDGPDGLRRLAERVAEPLRERFD